MLSEWSGSGTAQNAAQARLRVADLCAALGLAAFSGEPLQPARVHILGQFVDRFLGVFQVVSSVDLRFGNLDSGPNLVEMSVLFPGFLNEPLYSLANKSVRAIVFAAGNLFLYELFQFRRQCDGHRSSLLFQWYQGQDYSSSHVLQHGNLYLNR
jgi:hypothetical protein